MIQQRKWMARVWDRGKGGCRTRRRLGMQGSTQSRRRGHRQPWGRRYLAVATRCTLTPDALRVAGHTNMRAGSSRMPLSGRPNRCTRSRAEVAPFLAIAHLRRTERLRLLPDHRHCHRAAKGRVKPGRDDAWVCREQLRRSQDPQTHPRGGPVRTYNGCPQPFSSSARSPNARAMPP